MGICKSPFLFCHSLIPIHDPTTSINKICSTTGCWYETTLQFTEKYRNLKTIKSDRIANQKQAINRSMKTSTELDIPNQSHRGEDPVKSRRMEKLNIQKIEYGKNHKDKK